MTTKTFLDKTPDKSNDQILGSIVLSAKDVADTLNINSILTHENKKLKKKLDLIEKEIKEIKSKI